MISWTNLLTPETQERGNLRYSNQPGYIPRIVVWNTTRKCNLSCQHCYFEAMDTSGLNQLGTDQAKSFIKDLAKIGVWTLLFSGGEPLLREDIFELSQFAKERGIRPVLSTNGTLITEEIADKIKDAGFYYVGISLDGMEKTNDDFRQTQGAFRASISGIRNCKNLGLKVGLRFTLTKYNLKDLPVIFALAEKENIARFCIYHLVYSGRGNNLKRQDLSFPEKREVLELIWQKVLEFYHKGMNIEVLTVDNHADGPWIYLKLKKEDPRTAQRAFKLLRVQGGNSSGLRMGAVDDLGNIYPDQFLRTHPLGNICERKFSEVWQDKDNEFLSALRNRRDFLKGRCPRCNFLSICNGNFRARAFAVYGDIWQEDPACYLTNEEINEE